MGHLIHTYNVLPSSSSALLFHNPHSFVHFFNPCGWLSYLNNRPRCWILPTAKAHRNFVRRARHSFTQSPHQVFCYPGCVLRRIAPKDSSPSITHVLLSTWTFWWDNSRVHFTHSLNHSLTVLKFTRSSLVVSRKGCIAPRQVATSSRSFNCPPIRFTHTRDLACKIRFTIPRGTGNWSTWSWWGATLALRHFPALPVTCPWRGPCSAGSSADTGDTAGMRSVAGRCHWCGPLSPSPPTRSRADAFRTRTATGSSNGTRWLGFRAGPSGGHGASSGYSNISGGTLLEEKIDNRRY